VRGSGTFLLLDLLEVFGDGLLRSNLRHGRGWTASVGGQVEKKNGYCPFFSKLHVSSQLPRHWRILWK
jgi:hypothetical protein